MLETPALWVAFATMTPLMLFTAWHDIKYLKIPNWVPVSVLVIYCVTGLWGLPLDSFLRGLGAGAVILAVFFGLWWLADTLRFGKLGGGDIKLLSALVPFVFLKDALNVLLIYTVLTLLVATATMVAWGFRKNATGLASVDQSGKKVAQVASPFGVALGLTAIIYLGTHVQATMG